MKPTDEACFRQGSQSARVAMRMNPHAASSSSAMVVEPLIVGRRQHLPVMRWLDTLGAPSGYQERHADKEGRRNSGDLPFQVSIFEGEFKTEPYKAKPKGVRGWEGVGAVHSSGDYRDNITRCSGGKKQSRRCREGGGKIS